MGVTRRFSLLMLAVFCTAPAARAVVMMPGQNNTVAPSGASAWDHVGLVNGEGIVPGSGVYIGNRWVLTAAHVEGGNTNYIDGNGKYHLPVFTLPGRGVYTATYGTGLRVGAADLTLFRLSTDPGLTPIRFGRTPSLYSTITFAGFGYSTGTTREWWLANPGNPVYTTWSTTGAGWSNMSGYDYDTVSTPYSNPTRRWGKNVTVDADLNSGNGSQATVYFSNALGNTWVYTTSFDPNGISGEAQAAESDSGGGVFLNNRLVGITLYAWNWKNSGSTTLGQPKSSAAFWNATSFADTFSYVDQIASITQSPPSLLGDANLDGVVNKSDTRIILQSMGTGSMWSQGDFNLDGVVDLRDFQILERSFGGTLPSAAEVPDGLPTQGTVPEPAGVLLVAGTLAVLVGRHRGRKG